jgi:hypothetical protein
MDVQRQLRNLMTSFHDERAHGDVGDEMTIHDVDVDPISSGFFDLPELIFQSGEISRKDRGREKVLIHKVS